MNRIYFALIFLVIFSCTTKQKVNDSFTETVSLEGTTEAISVDVNKESVDTYGPTFHGEQQDLQKSTTERAPVVTLDFVPSLYASLSYITLFKELEKKKIYPNIMVANGFSLIIASLYGKYKNSNKLEWKVFALLRKLQGIKVYSSEWYDEIESFLNDEFGNTRIEQLKVLVVVPGSLKKQKLVTTGKVSQVIMDSLSLTNSYAFINKPHFKYQSKVKELGSDLYFVVNSLPKKFNFKTPNGFVWGLYTRISGLYDNVDKNVLNIKSDIKFLDTLPNLSDLLINTRSDVSQITDTISQEITEWVNKNN